MGQVASEVLASALATEPEEHEPLGWIARDLGHPFIDIEDKEALRAVLDGSR